MSQQFQASSGTGSASLREFKTEHEDLREDLPYSTLRTLFGITLDKDASQALNIALLLYGHNYPQQVVPPERNYAELDAQLESVVLEDHTAESTMEPGVSATVTEQLEEKSDKSSDGDGTSKRLTRSLKSVENETEEDHEEKEDEAPQSSRRESTRLKRKLLESQKTVQTTGNSSRASSKSQEKEVPGTKSQCAPKIRTTPEQSKAATKRQSSTTVRASSTCGSSVSSTSTVSSPDYTAKKGRATETPKLEELAPKKQSSATPKPGGEVCVWDGVQIGDLSAQMNAQIGDDEELDTVDIARRILSELKERCIPQTALAEKILARSQGTLSDLLRMPKPWSVMKNGRATFQRMSNWLGLDPDVRRALCFLPKEDVARITGLDEPTPAKRKKTVKVIRLTFTETQLKSLQKSFQQNHRPTREMRQKLSATLELDFSTVGNFFMNSRRRLRIDQQISRSSRSTGNGADTEDELDEEDVVVENVIADATDASNQPGPSHL